MKINNTIKSHTVTVVSYLYIFLFVYAAVSKLMDFENFQVQLGQSPLLSAYAREVALAVPLTELLIAVFLAFPFLRCRGLVGGYVLMTMFTVYIYLILHYSAFIPCSCGGILEKMNWDQHLLFNLLFMGLAVLALILFPSSKFTLHRKVMGIVLGTVAGVGIVVGLFLLSENKMKYDNGFVRRFPQHSAQEIHQRELDFNSYYFAGMDHGNIYLGNHTAPLLMTIIDTALQTQETKKIELAEKHLPFRRPSIKVFNENFYVYEGAIPYIFKGSIRNWNASLRMNSGPSFSQLEPIDSVHIVLRFSDTKTAENLIGTVNLSDTTALQTNPQLLKKQIDGIFDTDGSLHVDSSSQQVVYLYRYRNQYIIANSALQFTAAGHTIDTVRTAHLKIKEVKSHGIHTFSEPPLIVNKSSTVDGYYLYSNSLLRGKYESDYIWNNTSIIDVYNLKEQSYSYSFTLNGIANKKVKSFVVSKNRLYALIGTKIIAYKLIDYKEIVLESP